jgi:ABC-type glycerol-3-phosphate transport system permease component
MSDQPPPTSRLQKILYIFLAAVILIPIIWMSVSIVQTRDLILADLQELNKSRENAFSEIRQILMRYRDEQGEFPETLDQLVPEYTPSISEVLLKKQGEKTSYNSMDISVKYVSTGSTATFSFQRGYDHTPVIKYDVLTATYSDKTELPETTIQND